jgi:putative RecB family exonuclease
LTPDVKSPQEQCALFPRRKTMMIEELRNQPHLSVSSIQKYIDCGMQYKFSRIDNLPPEHVSDNLVFGTAIHQVLAEFNQERLSGSRMKLEDLQHRFADIWHTKAYGNEWISYSAGRTYENLLTLGKSLLETFYRQLPAREFTVAAIEEAFQFQIDGLDIPIIGVMDLVEEDDVDGSIVITEYKTAAKAYGLDEVSDVDYVYLVNLLVYVDRVNPKQGDWACVRIG